MKKVWKIYPYRVSTEYYARDISKKIRSSKKVQAQKGEFYGSVTAYGYKRNPLDKHKLVVDEEAAAVIRQIFEMNNDGLGNFQIAKELNDRKILAPSAYRQSKDGIKAGALNEQIQKVWHSNSVVNILKNRVYIGDMVGHKNCTKSFKNHRYVEIPESERIIVEGKHEAIIDRETFARAQVLRKVKNRQNKAYVTNIFVGLLFCADCGAHLHFHSGLRANGKAGRYICGKYSHSTKYSRDHAACTMHNITFKALYDLTLLRINEILSANLTADDVLEKLSSHHDNVKIARQRLEKLNKRKTELKAVLQRVVEQNVLGKIEGELFSDLYDKYGSEYKTIAAETSRLEAEMSSKEQNKENSERFHEILQRYTVCKELSREMVLDFIDRIVVHEAMGVKKDRTREQIVEIYYRFVGRMPT